MAIGNMGNRSSGTGVRRGLLGKHPTASTPLIQTQSISWVEPYPDEPNLDEIVRKITVALDRMADRSSKTYVLADRHVSDFIFMVEGRYYICPPDNRDVQPLFGRQTHVFFMKDVFDRGCKDYVCVYDTGKTDNVG